LKKRLHRGMGGGRAWGTRADVAWGAMVKKVRSRLKPTGSVRGMDSAKRKSINSLTTQRMIKIYY